MISFSRRVSLTGRVAALAGFVLFREERRLEYFRAPLELRLVFLLTIREVFRCQV